MKTFEQFIQESAGVTLSLSVIIRASTPRDIENNAQAYARYIATKACEDLKERIAEKASLSDKNWILNTETILP